MVRIVREQRCGDGDRPRGAIEVDSEPQPDRLAIGDDFRRRPFRFQHASIRRDLEPAGDHPDDGLAVP